jgi:streptogramin lyase
MATLLVGQVVGGHRIESVAGRGGMGVVYRATHLALNRVVALKLIAPELAQDAEFRARFKRESELAASLDHPNVVPIYHAGEDDGLLYVTMRFVDGTDLREMIALRGRLEPAQAARIVSQVASALDAAHARGLVHRDIKPANVLVSLDERHAYLTDFGLTKQASSQTGLTKTGMMVGTLDYIAPEQLQGATVDARTDVYALGCVLFEALTGRVPYPRDSEPAKMWAHMSEPPPAVTAAAPGLPAPFDEVVGRSMAKEPDRRYPSAGDLGRAALAAAAGEQQTRAERSVATGDAAQGQATAPGGEGAVATRIDTPPPGGPVAPSPGAPRPGWEPAAKKRRSQLPFVIGGVVLAVVVLGLVAVLALGGGDDGKKGGGTPAAAKAPAGVWIVTGEKSVTRVDPKTGRVVATVRGVGSKLVGIAAGQGAVWAADGSGSQVVRIDPETNRVVARVPLGATANAIAAGPEGVFVAAGPTLIARIDPRTNRIATRVDAQGAYDLATGLGFAWGTNFLDGDLKRIAPAGLATTSITAGLGKEPRFVAVGEGAVWVLNSDRTLSRLRSANPGASSAVQIKTETSTFPGGLAAGEGGVWVTEASTLWRYDPATNRLAQTIDLGSSFVSNGIAVGGGYVWLTDFAGKELIRVNPKTGTVSAPTSVSGDTARLAVGP